ncbi:hypothetical protein EV356DRAFT_510978 [Viridothelium virens]|uniref:AB hydrolase-1 domain-containing protein n=1 Tax=Viridothelium virens TaxID=1048519 RepID=A0A6A6GVJ6_VIRVR|nr:hypothetical protein EV356DRAFT_510978 [Viridothelium virens]
MRRCVPTLHALLHKVLANRGNTIVLVVHSAGGFIGANAVPGLTLADRKSAGLPGGVINIIAIMATLVREAKLDQCSPFFESRGERLFVKDPEKTLVNDLSQDIAKPEWDRPPKYGPFLFDRVSSIYLIYKGNNATLVELQMTWAELAKSEIRECDAGHLVMLSQSRIVVDLIKDAVESVA